MISTIIRYGADSLEPLTVRAPVGERPNAFPFAAVEVDFMVAEHRLGMRLARRDAWYQRPVRRRSPGQAGWSVTSFVLRTKRRLGLAVGVAVGEYMLGFSW